MSRAWRRRLHEAEDGFTLVELVIAMFVVLLIAASFAGVFVGNLRSVSLAKQRQAASGLATGVMEQFRAIDYGTLSSGLYCSDLAGDPAVTVAGGTCTGTPSATFAPAGLGISESIQLTTAPSPASAQAPLYPHLSTTVVEGATYTVGAYVTNTPGAPTPSYNLTVLVSWSSPATGGATKTVVQRSTEFSPSRCLSSAEHPYAGACQAGFNGDAGLLSAGITVVNSSDPTAVLPNLGATTADLTLPALGSTLGVEQVTKLSGLAQTMGATSTASGTKTTAGSIAGTVAAGTDPSSTGGTSSTGSVAQANSAGVTTSGTAGSLTTTPTSADAGSLDAEASSTATSCQDSSGTTVATATRPCIWDKVGSAGSGNGSIVLNLANGAPSMTLASVAPDAAPARASVFRLGAPANGACTGTSGVGCIASQSARSLGTVAIGGLPARNSSTDSPPAGYSGSLITVSNLTETAKAEAGVSPNAPSFSRTGTVSYYQASTGTYQTITIGSLTADQAVDLGTITGTWSLNAHSTTVQVTGNLKVGAPAALNPTTTAPDPACKSTACTTVVTGSSALTATLNYQVTVDGVLSTSFTVNANLGSVIAKSSYKAAFNA